MQIEPGYLDYSGKDDVLGGGVKLIPVSTPGVSFGCGPSASATIPTSSCCSSTAGPGRRMSTSRRVTATCRPRGSSTTTTTSSDRPTAISPSIPTCGTPTFRRGGRAGPTGLGLDKRTSSSWATRGEGSLPSSTRSSISAPEGPRDLQHDVEHPGVQPVCRDRAMPAMDQDALSEIKDLEADGDIDDPRYMELLFEHHYVHHVLRMPAEDWPEPVDRSFAHINQAVYIPMQGPSEFGASGRLANGIAPETWSVSTCRPWCRRPSRHHGPRFPGDDGRPTTERHVPALPGRQPLGDVRRPGDLLRRPRHVPSRIPRVSSAQSAGTLLRLPCQRGPRGVCILR